MTHSHGDAWFTTFVMTLIREATPFPHAMGYTLELNYGELDINWTNRTITSTVYGVGNTVLLQRTLQLQDMVGRVGQSRRHAVKCVPYVDVHPVRVWVPLIGVTIIILGVMLSPVVVACGVAWWLLSVVRRRTRGKQD
jgi:hypothetical protein